MKANFIVPFDPITRQTTLPLEDDRPIDFVHLTMEKGSSVVVQVQASKETIQAMKAAPTYCWLEDIPEVDNAIKG